MRVLIVAHVGETLGHLVRGLGIADALAERGATVEIAADRRASTLLGRWRRRYRHHVVAWEWSHNALRPGGPRSRDVTAVTRTGAAVQRLLLASRPDVVVGLPGVFSTQIARASDVPHVSVVHAPYLWPVLRLEDPTPAETAIGRVAASVLETFEALFAELSRSLGVPALDYEQFLDSEPLLVPQPGLALRTGPNVRSFPYIRASYGEAPALRGSVLASTCHVTFGSGNPCDLSPVVRAARRVFPSVLVAGARPRGVPKRGVTVQPAVASSGLVGRVAAVVSHGGMGTVGTFAEHGTPQLVVPTEIDQATMAALGRRQGHLEEHGLDAWAADARLGRRLPPIDEARLAEQLAALRDGGPRAAVAADGAEQIAEHLLAGGAALRARRPLRTAA